MSFTSTYIYASWPRRSQSITWTWSLKCSSRLANDDLPEPDGPVKPIKYGLHELLTVILLTGFNRLPSSLKRSFEEHNFKSDKSKG